MIYQRGFSEAHDKNVSTVNIYRPPLCLAGEDLPEPVTMPFRGGEVAIFTSSSPIAGRDNEDAIGVFDWGKEFGVLAVADGVGGLPGGGQASRQVIEKLRDPPAEDDSDPVASRLEAANEAFLDSGGGTTVSILVIHGSDATSYHVGDSALLIVGGSGQVKLETIPHSTVGRALANSEIDEKTAMYHPMRHIVHNMIGMRDMWVDTAESVRLDDRDTVIVASDGLWDNLYRDEVVEQMDSRSLAVVAKELVEITGKRMKSSGISGPSKLDDLSFILYRQV